jgi:4-amino-4-deoxy-L-arabinose transferase-like glycosyltransferase
MKTTRLDILLIAIIGVLTFTLGIHHQEFAQFNARFGLFTKNMYLHGLSFFPTTYGNPYPDYPGLPIVLIVLVSKLFGGVNLLTAILPTAIASTLTLIFTYKIAALQNRRWGWFGALFALFTYQFTSEARMISFDQYIVLAATLTFWLVYSANHARQKTRLYWLPCVFIFGFFCRGPIGLVIPAGVMCFYFLLNQNWPSLIKHAIIAAITLTACLAALLLMAKLQGGSTFVKSVLQSQIFGRVAGTSQHGFGFYWTRSIGNYMITMPIAFAAMIILAKSLIKPTTEPLKLMQQLSAWALLIMIAMSIPAQKKLRYILPIVPPMSLISAYLFTQFNKNNALHVVKKITLLFSEYLPLIGIIAGGYLFHYNKRHDQLPLAENMSALIVLLMCVFIGIKLLKRKLREPHKKHAIILMGGMISVFAAQLFIIEPSFYLINLTRPFTHKIDQISKTEHRQIVFYQVEPDGLAIKYLVNANMDFTPTFIYTHQQLLNYPKKAIFVSGDKAFYQTSKDLLDKINIVVKGQIGHDDAVAFVLHSPSKSNNS